MASTTMTTANGSSKGENGVGRASTIGCSTLSEDSFVETTEEESSWRVENKWVFNEEQLRETPSRKCGVDPLLETKYRRHTSRFIAELARQLQLTQLVVNSAIVMMHRFYMYHSFTKFNLFEIGMACLFLACKGEEQLRRIQDLVASAHAVLTGAIAIAEQVIPADNFTRTIALHKRRLVDGESMEAIIEEMISKVVDAELFILGTLGFDLSVDQAHTYVAQGCKDLALPVEISKNAYLFANASLIDTRMCLRFNPKFVACVCISAAIKACGWDLQETAGEEWWIAIDKGIEKKMLYDVTRNFLNSQQMCVNNRFPLKKSLNNCSFGRTIDLVERC